jgi:hypothetical protein
MSDAFCRAPAWQLPSLRALLQGWPFPHAAPSSAVRHCNLPQVHGAGMGTSSPWRELVDYVHRARSVPCHESVSPRISNEKWVHLNEWTRLAAARRPPLEAIPRGHPWPLSIVVNNNAKTCLLLLIMKCKTFFSLAIIFYLKSFCKF